MEDFIKNELLVDEGSADYKLLYRIGKLFEYIVSARLNNIEINQEMLKIEVDDLAKDHKETKEDALRAIQYGEMTLKINNDKIAEFNKKATEVIEETKIVRKLVDVTVKDMFIEDGLKGSNGFVVKLKSGAHKNIRDFAQMIYKQAGLYNLPEYVLPNENADTAELRIYFGKLYDFIEEHKGVSDIKYKNANSLRGIYLDYYNKQNGGTSGSTNK